MIKAINCLLLATFCCLAAMTAFAQESDPSCDRHYAKERSESCLNMGGKKFCHDFSFHFPTECELTAAKVKGYIKRAYYQGKLALQMAEIRLKNTWYYVTKGRFIDASAELDKIPGSGLVIGVVAGEIKVGLAGIKYGKQFIQGTKMVNESSVVKGAERVFEIVDYAKRGIGLSRKYLLSKIPEPSGKLNGAASN